MEARTLSPRSDSPIQAQQNSVVSYDEPIYLHTSTFRSKNIELSIRSPSIDLAEDPKFIGQYIPVFTGRHSVGGTVITAIPPLISIDHELVISIEGAFFWIGPQKEESQTLPLASPLPKRIKHVFLSSSVTIPLSPLPLDSPLHPSVSIRAVFQDGIRSTFRRAKIRPRRRRGKTGSINANVENPYATYEPERTVHSFTFPLPVINDHEVPGTICVSRVCPGGIRGRWYAEGAQIAYKLTAQVYPVAEGDEDTRTLEEQLEAPIFIQSDGFDGNWSPQLSWSYTELVCLRRLPFKCVLSLPEPTSFSRSDTIEFYVFFKITPESEDLARKLAKGANIRVSLIRQLRMDPGLAIAAPLQRTRHSEDGAQQRALSASPRRRATTRTPKIFDWQRAPQDPVWSDKRSNAPGLKGKDLLQNKPLPALPKESSKLYEDVICTVVSEGFPKRLAFEGKHSRAYQLGSTSDGVFKGEMHLSNELSNTIDWPGISLSYFVEASVLFENELLRARRRVRLAEAYI